MLLSLSHSFAAALRKHDRIECIQQQRDKILSTFDWICSFVNSIEFDIIAWHFLYVCVHAFSFVCAKFTFQFKINRNFMSFHSHSVWTSTQWIFLCFVFDCQRFSLSCTHSACSILCSLLLSFNLFWRLFEMVHEFLMPMLFNEIYSAHTNISYAW